MTRAQVLLVEDDEAIRRFLLTSLEAEGYSVHEAATAREAEQLAANRRLDLFLVDLGLPDGDGLNFIEGLRKWSHRPVIVLSARAQEREKVAALDAGADDYLVKPFGVAADKMGIDLIWFGVLLCVNMQTSFMHPPFGFALFYLRGISDTLFKNGGLPRKVESKDIYLGSIPWVLLQLLLVVIVIFVPQTVTVFLDKEEKVDLDKVKIEAPAEGDLSIPAPANDEKAVEDLFKQASPDPAAPASAAR